MHDFFDPSQWKQIPQSPEAIEAKKQTFRIMRFLPTIRDFSQLQEQEFNTFCEDVDFCAFLLSHKNFDTPSFYQLAAVQEHFQSFTLVKYFLSLGVSEKCADILFHLHPEVYHDKNFIFTVVAQYPAQFKDKISHLDFVLECLDKNIVLYDFLKSHPKHELITRKLLEKRMFPRVTQELSLYNDDVMHDKEFLLPILGQPHGYYLYRYLPKSLQFDSNISDQVKNAYPLETVFASSINTLDEFFQYIDKHHQKYYLPVVLNDMKHLPFIINNVKNIVSVFQFLVVRKYFIYNRNDRDGGYAKNHPIQDFLIEISEKFPEINTFLATPFGQEVIEQSVNGDEKAYIFDIETFPMLSTQLERFLLAQKLEDTLIEHKVKPSQKI